LDARVEVIDMEHDVFFVPATAVPAPEAVALEHGEAQRSPSVVAGNLPELRLRVFVALASPPGV